MKLETLNPEHKQILLNIQKSVPSEWLSKVTKREHIAPTVKEVMEKAINDPDVSEETKEECRMVLNSALMQQQVDSEVSEVAELIDAYIEKEIIKAVILKKLPALKKKKSFEVANKRFNKLKEKYDRQN